MAFPKSTLIAVIAASAAVCSIDAFVAGPSSQSQTFVVSQKNSRILGPLGVSLSSVDDLVGADNEGDEDSEPAPEDFIVSAGDLDDAEADADAEDDGEPPEWYQHQTRLAELRQQYRRHERDTGSPEFQVAGMTERITYLTKHLKTHPKDFSTRRGLVALVNKRRRLLNYLYRENVERYASVVKSLGIRHKAPGNVESREEKYGRFPPQKDRKK